MLTANNQVQDDFNTVIGVGTQEYYPTELKCRTGLKMCCIGKIVLHSLPAKSDGKQVMTVDPLLRGSPTSSHWSCGETGSRACRCRRQLPDPHALHR